MNFSEIVQIRLASQKLAATNCRSVKELVCWMGAMQAQDYAMVKWAVGTRLLHATDKIIETAISLGEVIRTHLLRPTWHLVSADDIYWMLELTAPQIKASLKSRRRDLGLSKAVLAKSNRTIEHALEDGKHLTRQEMFVALEKAGIVITGNGLSHLLLEAELCGIVCSGEIKEGKQTYACLAERVPKTKRLTREEALAKLAKIYFNSRNPATIQDFSWWSGLSVKDSKLALEMIKSDFISATIASHTYWFPITASTPSTYQAGVYLLPAYDEFLISYKDRSASIPYESYTKAVSSNGVFRPVIVVNGHITGIWKRIIKKDKVCVVTEFFAEPDAITKSRIEKAALEYGHFLGKDIEIKHMSFANS